MRQSAFPLILLLTAALAGCAMASTHSKEKVLDETLKSYAATIRWGDIAQAQSFLDPEYRERHPLSTLDVARYRQVQVTYYHDAPAVPVNDTEISQTVEIGLVNVNTQSARSVVDHQTWHYDETARRWWLVSGLPDITHGRD
ncbi:MAG TPA: hypothetical protein VFG55_01700 [Rhodanobacteraceae bacterium]|nr:hypothetical protein [Rhodanobacteraceae bacterium]